MQQNNNITISRVETPAQLDTLLENGLAQLYKDVFGGAPYFEEFTLDEVKSIFRDFMDKKGIIFAATDAGKPVAFVVSVPLRAEFELAKIAKPYGIDADKTAYFAEDGVAADYRRNGLSGKMKQLLLDANSAAGLKQILLRTSTKNYAQINAVNKAGGCVLKKAFQKVVRKTKDGAEVDNNLFYLFDGSKRPLYEAEKVMVVRNSEGKDEAFVFNQPENTARWPGWLNSWAAHDAMEGICTAYPELAEVSFVTDLNQVKTGKVLFDGRLHVNAPSPYKL